MAALALQLTTAGLTAVRAPAGTQKTVIAKLGLTAQPFVAAPTLTALPGEFKRLDILSGVAAAPTVAHITAYDTSADTWSATGFGLFLEDGTLFASYSAAAPVLSKAGVAFALMAFDIAFNADVLAEITFGDATFVWPPATETTRGIAKLATQARVDAAADGEDDAQTIVTPKTLRARLATLWTAVTAAIGVEAQARSTADAELSGRINAEVTARGNADSALGNRIDGEITARVNADTVLGGRIDTLQARTITGSGLVSGGGDLSGNRTLTVTEATAAEITAGTAADKVVTPRRLGPITMQLQQNGFIRFFGFQMAWGRFTADANGNSPVVFVQAFPTACFAVSVSGTSDTSTDAKDNWPTVRTSTITATGFTAFNANDGSGDACSYIAVGY